MKNTEFRAFLNTVFEANEQSDIWWDGSTLISLNTAQMRRLMEYLEVRPFIKRVKTLTNKDALLLPSGICIEYK